MCLWTSKISLHVYGCNGMASICWMQSHGGPVEGADAPQLTDIELSSKQALPSSAQQYFTIGPRSDVVYPVCTIVMCERHVASAGSPGVRELSVALMPRSLLVFSAEAYTDCLHGIDPVRPAAAVSC